MNDMEQMIVIINRKNIFRKFTDDATVWNARERFHMPNIYHVLEIHGTQGVSAGYSTWYFTEDGHYLACGFDS